MALSRARCITEGTTQSISKGARCSPEPTRPQQLRSALISLGSLKLTIAWELLFVHSIDSLCASSIVERFHHHATTVSLSHFCLTMDWPYYGHQMKARDKTGSLLLRPTYRQSCQSIESTSAVRWTDSWRPCTTVWGQTCRQCCSSRSLKCRTKRSMTISDKTQGLILKAKLTVKRRARS